MMGKKKMAMGRIVQLADENLDSILDEAEARKAPAMEEGEEMESEGVELTPEELEKLKMLAAKLA